MKQLHCDICNKVMPAPERTIKANYENYCVKLEVWRKPEQNESYSFIIADVCQSCKRTIMFTGVLPEVEI